MPPPSAPEPIHLDRLAARRFLVAHQGLTHSQLPPGDEGVRAMLRQLRCIQLDPLDPLGTNADLVALARVDDLKRGQVYDALLPGHAFEHWAKERCLLPKSAFPWYRDRTIEAHWWRLSSRHERLPEGVIEAVLAEVEAQGPATSAELTHHGAVAPLDWNGWKGTSSATTMALEVLWTRCQVVVCGRTGSGKRYDVPHRALPDVHDLPASGSDDAFGRWALAERVEAAGLLSRAKGPMWGMLSDDHRGALADTLVAEGSLAEVVVEGSARRYLASPASLERPIPEPDGRMRILGPLDPVLWDRKLVAQVFGFDYIWEVYKPKEVRRWGWYVCPLLHTGALVGRLEGRVEDGQLVIDNLWEEAKGALDTAALDAALERHAQALGAGGVKRPRRLKVG